MTNISKSLSSELDNLKKEGLYKEEKIILSQQSNIVQTTKIEETINLNELSKSTKLDEIFYTFSEYKNDILEEVFMKKSKYIMQTGVCKNMADYSK